MVSKSQRMQPSSSKDKVPNYKNKEKSRSKIIDNLHNIIFFDNPQSVVWTFNLTEGCHYKIFHDLDLRKFKGEYTFTFYKDNYTGEQPFPNFNYLLPPIIIPCLQSY